MQKAQPPYGKGLHTKAEVFLPGLSWVARDALQTTEKKTIMEFTYNKYIDDVMQNRITVCKKVKQAVKRHCNDLQKSKTTFPYYFDDKRAQNAIQFFGEMVHTKGLLAGQKLKSEPWQQFIIASIYGWRRKDNNLRRFRRCYIQIARKNGKTFFSAGVGLYDLISENGAEVYSAATKRDQARRAFLDAKNTVKYSKILSKHVQSFSNALVFRDGSFTALSSDYESQDSLNPSCAIIDEYHAHRDDNLLNVIQSGMGQRQQPLLFIITTAGHNLNSPCHEEYERCEKMLEGLKGYENDEYFAMIYELDARDDWRNEANWCKANPNLYVEGAVSIENLRSDYQNALQKSSSEAEFKTKRLNLWVNNADTWIPASKWARCQKRFSEEKLAGLPCYGGIDLSKRNDFTALTLYFPLPDGKVYAKHHFYIPEAQIDIKMKTDNYRIREWIKKGYITATPGETVDYSYMESQIFKDAEVYDIQEIAYDRNLALRLIEDLAGTFNMTDFGQSIVAMSEPSKDWEKLVVDGKLIDNNPVMEWMVSCATIRTDANSNIKVVKPDSMKSSKRIDGVITSIMAYNRLASAVAETEKQNISIDQMIF